MKSILKIIITIFVLCNYMPNLLAYNYIKFDNNLKFTQKVKCDTITIPYTGNYILVGNNIDRESSNYTEVLNNLAGKNIDFNVIILEDINSVIKFEREPDIVINQKDIKNRIVLYSTENRIVTLSNEQVSIDGVFLFTFS